LPTPLYDLEGVRAFELLRNQYFVVEEVAFQPGARYMGWCEGETMEIWGCMQGAVQVHWSGDALPLNAIRYGLLPATLGEYAITARAQRLLAGLPTLTRHLHVAQRAGSNRGYGGHW
jgi:hypothetical protein